MAFGLFNAIQANILPKITVVADKSSELIGWVTPLIAIGLTIVLMIQGFEVIRGGGGHNYFLDWMHKAARPVFVVSLALFGGAYASNVVGFFNDLRTSLTGLFASSGENSYASLDASVDKVLSFVVEMIPVANKGISILSGEFHGVVIYVCLAVLAICHALYAIVAVFNLIMIDASLAIVFGLGPIFIAAAAFNTTSRIFDSWLSAVIKYTITAVIMSMIIGISNAIMSNAAGKLAAKGDATDFIWESIGVLCASLILCLLASRAAAIAADLAGGAAMQLASPIALSRTIAPAAAAAGAGAMNAGGYAAGAAASGAARAASAASGTGLGIRVMQAASGMRQSAAGSATRASAAAMGGAANSAKSGFQNFAHAVRGTKVEETGRTTRGHGFSNAYDYGRQAASRSAGTGTITGAQKP